jgi:hypothetical protein
MAKRRKRSNKQPDLPAATLQRARAQIRGEDVDAEETEAQAAADAEAEAKSRREERRARRRAAPQPVQYARRHSDKETDQDYIQDLLANPTRQVSEAELREEYGHVVRDIRGMFLLAGGLMVLLVALAQFI